MSSSNSDEIVKRFGLESVPEAVRRLAALAMREDATVEQLGEVISTDASLTARLLRAANPRAESEEDYVATTVDEALMRTGVGCALLLAMGEPLVRAVLKTFHMMLAVNLETLATSSELFEGDHILSEIAFTGKATGAAGLRMTGGGGRYIAAHMLGVSLDDLGDDAEVDDVIGELTNMIVGNFKSNLCDAGLDCVLSPPAISRISDFKIRSASGSLTERIAFQATEVALFVDLSVNPWGD